MGLLDKSGSRWTQASSGMLHMKVDDMLVMLVHLDCPLTDGQRQVLGELHSFVLNVHSEISIEPVTCDYVAFLREKESADPEPDITYRV